MFAHLGKRRENRCRPATWLLALATSLFCGCTSIGDYVHNGFKVGPNYGRPAAPVAKDWIDGNDSRVVHDETEQTQWWTVFHDPALDSLICTAYHQNLTLREAGFRILEARPELGIDTGNLFPQTQNATGSYEREAVSKRTAEASNNLTKHFFNQTNFGFNLAWELDFWGRFRRAIESDSAALDASVENYDAALLTLLGDVATDYAQMRTTEQRIKYADDNIRVQRDTLAVVEARFKASTISELDLDQARSTLAATEAAIPELEISLRQTINQLCTLLGMPPEELRARLGPGNIPTPTRDVVVGIPADLLRRRPDVRAAERQLAAQCALIGVAEAEFYPAISITGTYGYQSAKLSNLFEPAALAGSVGPSFQWNLLNYGRIQNGVRLQDSRFQELLATYQQTVLNANQDVENELVTFLRGQMRTRLQQESVDQAKKAVEIALIQYRAGTVDFTTVTQVEQTLVQQEDILAQAQGEIVGGLIGVYRALGGGWQIRLTGCNETLAQPGVVPAPWQPPAEPVPPPTPTDVKPIPPVMPLMPTNVNPMPPLKDPPLKIGN